MQNNTNNQAQNVGNCCGFSDIYMPIKVEGNPPKFVRNFWVQQEIGKNALTVITKVALV